MSISNLSQYSWDIQYSDYFCTVSQIAESINHARKLIETSMIFNKKYNDRKNFLRIHIIDEKTDTKMIILEEQMNTINKFEGPCSSFQCENLQWLYTEPTKVKPLFSTMLISHR